MIFSKLQKILASFLLFIFFFGQITGLSFIGLFTTYNTYAEGKAYHDLVSIIVDEGSYKKLKTEVDRYAEDIQKYLNNTKVVILPIKKTNSSFQIMSLNESLFTDGYKSLKKDVNFESRLVGTILIGSFPIPLISKDGEIAKSIIPYVDFEDKKYIYNPETQLFEENSDNLDGFHAEIWEGVISPNTGNFDSNVKEIKNFLDKDHDFYEGKGLFDNKKEILNGKKSDKTSKNYKPFVFYFDQIREQDSINAISYKGYEAYVNNKEDIVYHRYTKDLAKKIRDEIMGEANDEVKKLIQKLPKTNKIGTSVARAQYMLIQNGQFDLAKQLGEDAKNGVYGEGPDLEDVNDISTKVLIDKATNKFIQIFNPGTIGDFRKNVHNAGRYNMDRTTVNVDFIPSIISILDVVGDKVIKSATNGLENQIDKVVVDNLAKKIKIPTIYEKSGINSNSKYVNYYAGRKAEDLKYAADCTIYRGNTNNNGQLVEANRGYDFRLADNDAEGIFFDKEQVIKDICDEGSIGKTKGIYGGSSPLNIYDYNGALLTFGKFKLKLKDYDLNKAVLPLFDISGGKKFTTSSKNPSPKNCLKTNFVKVYEHKESDTDSGTECTYHYEILSKNNGGCFSNSWNCGSENIINSSIKGDPDKTVSIPSYMIHKSPTLDEVNNQIQAKFTPNLPVDKVRYIDYFSEDVDVITGSGANSYEKIVYPNLFKVKGTNTEEIKKNLDKLLDDKSAEIKKLGGNIDLKRYLKTKVIKTVKIGGEDKKYSFYDFVVFSIYWNNLHNTSSRYKFVLQNYLSDQVGGNQFDFVLADNKKEYEIAYLGAHGDAKNMYVMMDTKGVKVGFNPYENVFQVNSRYEGQTLPIRMNDPKNYTPNSSKKKGGMFKCAPPDGVPIWVWIPAIICRLKSILPPKVGIKWVCGKKPGGGGKGGKNTTKQPGGNNNNLDDCENDEDKNGINDCLQDQLKGARIVLSADKTKYHYGQFGRLKTKLLDKNGKEIYLDSFGMISYKIDKIIDRDTNKVVFDAKKDDFDKKFDLINQYVFFMPASLVNAYGNTNFTFNVQSKRADVYFKAYYNLKPTSYEIPGMDLKNSGFGGYNMSLKIKDAAEKLSSHLEEIKLKSNDLLIKIRNSKLFIDSRFTDKDKKIDAINNGVIANDKTNVYLIGDQEFEKYKYNPNSLILKLVNFNEQGKKRAINFPIDVILEDEDGEIIKKEKFKNLNQLKELYSLKKAGKYKINIKDSFGFEDDYEFEIVAGMPTQTKIKLGSTILSNSGTTTNVVSIYDKFDNIVVGEIFDYKLNIISDSLTFDDDSKELELTSFEGYNIFQLKANGKVGNAKIVVEVKDEEGKKITGASKNIRIIDELKTELQIKDNKELQVGNKEYTATLIFKDKTGKILNDLNSRVYTKTPGKYLSFDSSFYEIKNGKATLKFNTRTTAGEDVVLKIRTEGFTENNYEHIKILPGKPMSITILPEKTKLEANPKASTKISILLKDVYKNTVFTDNKTKISLEILDQYKSLLTAQKNEMQLKKGVANFTVNATLNPGVVYIKFKTDKKLEDNFVILHKGKKKQKINGVSENALRLETFFFYKKSEIIGRKYNALYTTLLGAEYGDILQKDYLASGMLFDKNNRSLAVTTLLNSPYNNYDILSISNNGIIQKSIGRDMTQDLSIELLKGKNDKYYLDLFNRGLNVHIGEIYLNFDDLDISDETYDKIANDDVINLGDLGIEKFESFYVDSEALLDVVLKKQKNSIIFHLETQEYYLRNILLGEGKKAIAISYNDPFAGDYELNDFTEGSLDSYENFEEKDDLGWSGGNKTLLEFAAGSSVGEASRKYMGVFGITLGDPVISLKKIRPKYKGIEKKFDPTTGKKLNNTRIKTYRTFDYNADGKKDILLVENNGFMSLLENKDSNLRFLNQKHLVRVFDLGKKTNLILTGDFSGDSYDDIFYVDRKGEPHLLNNDTKDFVFYDLKESFKLKGAITQAESFDMDHDGVDDIVTLDTFGEINIFYGRKDSITKFDKKLVYNGYGIKLNETKRSSLGAIYYDGLPQKVPEQKNIKDTKDVVPLDLLQGIMFEDLPYISDVEDLQLEVKTKKFLKSEYAKDIGISITKKLKDKNGGNLMKGDVVEVELKIKNNTNKTLKNIVYAEDIPKFFKMNYGSIQFKDKQVTTRKNLLNYKFYLDKFDLKPKEELTLYYTMKTKTLLYKYMKVGLFEKGEAGDDEYGDILVKESPYNCGGDADLFRSVDKRKYKKGKKEETCYGQPLPPEIAKNEIDKDGNGVPDYIDAISLNEDTIKAYSSGVLDEFIRGEMIDEDMDPTDINTFNGTGALFDTKNMIQGFNCGFGNNDCYCSPVNWAPLAPGNDPVIYGKLVGDGLKIDEGIPVFSALTWGGGFCTPGAFPCKSKSPGCGSNGAGGYLGIDNPTNFFRLFITPTLTGSYGIAACFGAPARKAGAKPPKGMNPVVPGGNCLIWAKKLKNTCKDELPSVPPITPIPGDNPDGGKTNIENCSASPINPQKLPITNKIDTKLARSFLESLQKGILDPKLTNYFDNLKNGIDYMDHLDEKLFKGANENTTQASDSGGGDFEKVDEITNKRIPAFPKFFMSWVHDQNEEFINKLTNMPTLHIILPEFKGTNNGDWGKYADKMAQTPEALENTSGIKEAFNFMGNVPFMHVTPEPVNVNVPWGPNLHSTMQQWQAATSQWQSELNRVTQEAGNKMRPENIVKINKFRQSLMSNMQTIQSYMQLPQQISNLAGKKQKRLEQLLCYIEQMQKMTSGWIGKNGQRFKAWTQAYMTIKSALKSWQAILDVFIKYDNECHECKNERHDSLNAQFKIVDMVMPKIPVVRFPKWPNLVLDLHNIRIGMNVKIPEFKFQKRPMIMPQVPSLSLPSVSDCINFSINLPALPQLPKIQMPKLPDLPAIPVVEMPDLPPPPKLPKMFGSLEAMVDISKLVTKAMCILKKLPFFPEVRAGDEIAFLTEGHGYRKKGGGSCNLSTNFDFINLQLPKLPNPSIKFLKEIRVIVKINMQKDLDFLVKMAKAMVKPINSMTNNFSNKFGNMGINLDFSGLCNAKQKSTSHESEGFKWTVEGEGEENIKLEEEIPEEEDYNFKDTDDHRYRKKIYNKNSINPKGTNKIDLHDERKKFKELLDDSSSFKLTPLNLGKAISMGIQKVQSCIAQNANNTVSVPEFLSYVNEQLSSKKFISDPKLQEVRKSFDLVNNYTYSKEDKLIEKLQKQNIDKFSTLRNIIRQEIKKTEELKYDIINKKYQKISNNTIGVEMYNKALEKHNKEFEKSLKELYNPKYFDLEGLKKDGEKLKKKINDKLENFSKNTLGNDLGNKLLAYNSPSEYAYDTDSVSKCNKDHKTRRKYKGIYIFQEEKNIKLYYRLFEYLKEWNGKERVEHIDFDGDGDSDILYQARGNLYLKENLLKQAKETHLTGVEVLDLEDNKFVNGDTFYEVVNNSKESFAANKFMNIYFSASQNKDLNNYRLSFYQIIDKYQNLGNSSYVPKNIKNYIVDSFVSDSEIRKIKKEGTFTSYKDLAYIDKVGDNIGKAIFKVKILRNIKNSLKNGNVAVLGANQSLYAGKNDVTIKYIDEEKEKTLTIKAHTHIQSMYGIEITSVSNDAYVMTDRYTVLKGREILDYVGLPLDFESKITLNDNNFITSSESYINIKYYDGSEANIDFSKVRYYYLYDLGSQSDSYVITLNVENDFYYARMQVFKDNIFSTKTSQVLLSPQLKADKFAPEIDLDDAIRIPVYQKRLIDFSDSIYEDAGFSGIAKFEVEGLDKDKVKVYLTNQSVKISFGKFNTLFKKQIKFIVTDKNNNKTEKMIDFEVYTPIPEIDYVAGSGAIEGHINEALTDEPVNIYRYRGGRIEKLITTDNKTKVNTTKGDYVFNAKIIKSDILEVRKDGKVIFTVNENTGRIIGTKNSKYIIKTSIDEENLINIIVYERIGNLQKEIFREKIYMNESETGIREYRNFDEVKNNGLYFRIKDEKYDYYKIPDNVEYNPGTIVIYKKLDSHKLPLFAIGKDAKIKTLNNYYQIEYSSHDKYILINLRNKHDNKIIGEFYLKINNAFLIR